LEQFSNSFKEGMRIDEINFNEGFATFTGIKIKSLLLIVPTLDTG
jgi:hypothetical protein